MAKTVSQVWKDTSGHIYLTLYSDFSYDGDGGSGNTGATNKEDAVKSLAAKIKPNVTNAVGQVPHVPPAVVNPATGKPYGPEVINPATGQPYNPRQVAGLPQDNISMG